MRIGIDISKALPPLDGIGTYSLHIARALIEIADAHQIRLFALSPSITREDVGKIFPDLPGHCEIAPALTRTADQVDLFFTPAWHYPQDHRGPVVLTCHDLTVLSHPQFHLAANRIHTLRGTLEAIVGGAHFLCVSQHTQSEVTRRLSIPESRTSVVHEGFDKRFQPLEAEGARARLEERLGISRPFALSLSSLEPRKNLVRLLQAYDQLDEGLRQQYELLLVGPSGWFNDEIHAYIDTRSGDGEVRLLGYVNEDDQVDLYSAATVFVYPSLAEGFGLPVLEAMACGAPVCVSGSTSLPEVAGDAALFFDPLEVKEISAALGKVLGQPDLAAELCARSLRRAELFSWEKAAKETLDIFERLEKGYA